MLCWFLQYDEADWLPQSSPKTTKLQSSSLILRTGLGVKNLNRNANTVFKSIFSVSEQCIKSY